MLSNSTQPSWSDERSHTPAEEPEARQREGGTTSTDDSLRRTLTNGQEAFGKDMLAFFMLGIVIALPTMVATSAASSMFRGITGLMGICMSVAAAVTTFATPLFIHHVPYNARVLISFVASVLSFVICVLGSDVVGPAIGTILAGFVYAFGTSLYLSVGAFYDQRTVISFSTGSSFSAFFGTFLYIGFMKAFRSNWRHAILAFLPFAFVQPAVWYFMLSASNRRSAEQDRQTAKARDAERFESLISAKTLTDTRGYATFESAISTTSDLTAKSGFGPGRTRIGLFWKAIFPRYVLPLLTCTCGALFMLVGLTPTFEDLELFPGTPRDELNYQLSFLAYGAAQFLLAGLAILYVLPNIWLWALTQVFIVAVGIVQLFYPFLTNYGAWLLFMFATGGVVGGGIANTNYKVAEDFGKCGETDDVRAFAMSYAGLGNFGGDVLGGGLAILVQKLAEQHLVGPVHGPL